jgi:hypothetical protein
MTFNSLHLSWIKLSHFEFWPWKIFYGPLLPYYLFLAIKNRSIAFPSVVNVTLKDGGFFNENKSDILRNISPIYLPKSVEIKREIEIKSLDISSKDLIFPLVAKPLSGQRGQGVQKILSLQDLYIYHNLINEDYLLQEFIDYPVELAVLYSRLPNENAGIVSSIAQKEFLSVVGDGQSTIEMLLILNFRAQLIWGDLKKNLLINWDEIVPVGVVKIVEPIGNHCRGTLFRNAENLDFAKIAKVCDEILKDFKGFNYGRFDLKVSSIEDFYSGKNIKVLELNGVNADPAHIFDPNYSLFSALISVIWHWNRLSSIAGKNQKAGFKAISWNALKTNIFK